MCRIFLLIACFILSFANAEVKNTNFSNFTGKVTGSKVRLRTDADLDSRIITQLNKGSLFLVVGEKRDFYAVRPPINTKFYVFRSYIIDNTVEAHRVNVRLFPSLDAPVIGRLEHKQKIRGEILASNNKWIAISPPENMNFYIAKDYVYNIGRPDYYLASVKKQKAASKSTLVASNTSIKKALSPSTKANIQAFSENPKKEPQNLSSPMNVSEDKKTASVDFSNSNINPSPALIEPANSQAQTVQTDQDKIAAAKKPNDRLNQQLKDLQKVDMSQKMRRWLKTEADIFTSWSTFHPEYDSEDFYKEQLASCLEIEGFLEPFADDIQNKPGDYLIKAEGLPAAYLYSTTVNLEPYVNHKIKVRVSPRPNNNFAFPAYFVLEAE